MGNTKEPTMIIRKNAKDFGPDDKKAFTDAVLALKTKPSLLHPGDGLHSRYDDYVEVHLNAMNAMMIGHVQNWGHLSAAFGPWHRVLLAHFESELRMIDSSATLPFWDWTDADSTAAVFADDFLGSDGQGTDGQVMDGPFAFAKGKWRVIVKDDDSNPDFLARSLGADPSATALPDKTQDQDPVMALTDYDESPWYDDMRTTPAQRARVDTLFRFRLEYDLHNLIHRYVGGDMALAASPNDPVFWLHHCNIDRLWSLWEQTSGAPVRYAPMTGGPQGQSADSALIYNFAGAASPWSSGSIPGTPAAVLDSRAQLGIGYTTDISAVPLPTAFRAVPRLSMRMPPNAMYPLRREFHAAGKPHRHLFPLRAEFKGGA
jgi:tyrosinase